MRIEHRLVSQWSYLSRLARQAAPMLDAMLMHEIQIVFGCGPEEISQLQATQASSETMH